MNNTEINNSYTDFDAMTRNISLQLYNKNLTNADYRIFEINKNILRNIDNSIIIDIEDSLIDVCKRTLSHIIKNNKVKLTLYNVANNNKNADIRLDSVFNKNQSEWLNLNFTKTISSAPIIKIKAKDINLSNRRLRRISYFAKYKYPITNNNISEPNLSSKFQKYNKKMNKLTYSYGWLTSYENLSDSFIIFTKIKMYKIVCDFIKTFTEKINLAMKQHYGLNQNIIKENTDFKKFEDAWKNFQADNLSLNKLSNLVFH